MVNEQYRWGFIFGGRDFSGETFRATGDQMFFLLMIIETISQRYN